MLFAFLKQKLRIALSQTFFRSLQETFFFSARFFANVRKAVRNRAASGVRKRERLFSSIWWSCVVKIRMTRRVESAVCGLHEWCACAQGLLFCRAKSNRKRLCGWQKSFCGMRENRFFRPTPVRTSKFGHPARGGLTNAKWQFPSSCYVSGEIRFAFKRNEDNTFFT
mgnify:CR=1 FL=1